MKQTIAAFAGGALIASAIAILMNRRPEPPLTPAPPVAQTAPASAVEPPSPEPKPAPAAEPAPVPSAPIRAPEPERKPLPRATASKATARRDRPVEVARTEAAAPAPEPAVTPAPSPAPVAVPTVRNADPAPKTAEPVRAPVALNPPAGTATEPVAKPVRVAKTLTIPEGTLISVRLLEKVSSDLHASGDTFMASLAEPLVVDGFAIAERGAKVEGRVVQTEKGGRVKGTSFLSVELTQLSTADGQRVAIHTQTFERKAEESRREDLKKVGVGAAIGAAIGAIAGGGKGAAIGAGAGGAAGGGVAVAGRGKPAELPVETRISFKLSQPVTLTEKLSRAN